jgi:hypothetical protein
MFIIFSKLLIPWCKWIDDLLVHSPDLVPLHEDDGSGGTLSQDELLESFDGEASPENSPNRRKAGIVPTVDAAAVNEPGQLALGHHLDGNTVKRIRRINVIWTVLIKIRKNSGRYLMGSRIMASIS